MTERLIDAVCPHCGRVGTTVRVVLHEDGYTKLSRRCTDCGGECIHTFDHDWLAAANNKKLRSENERLTSDVALVAERVRQLSEERDYAWAEVARHRAEIERLRDEIKRLRAKIKWLIEDDERLHSVLYRIANPRPFADCPVEMAQNATRGEHLRREAFDGIRRVLEGKP